MREDKLHNDEPEVPIGLGMAMAKNMGAMNHYAAMTVEGKKKIIEETHNIRSKQDMKNYVDSYFGTKN